ncbi:MAG: hypothetical protein EXX96DRAFT_584969 [Benjaminiella poitrasii]|nr:MAG: hypothetical protein EXX96DRAFT_584969 [Benjaminiella poitrasii]
MENNKSNSFQLWSPPTLDLSLDSFSNDLIQEFDKKTRFCYTDELPIPKSIHQPETTTTNITEKSYLIVSTSSENTLSCPDDNTVQQEVIVEVNSDLSSESSNKQNDLITDQQNDNRSSIDKKERNSVISLPQYPPKPLQYSALIDPPSDDIMPSTNMDNNPLVAGKDGEKDNRTISEIYPTMTYTKADSPLTNNKRNKSSSVAGKMNNIASSDQNHKVSPKRRSFFSLRFC